MKNMIISALLDKRSEHAPEFQEILTRHGCIINVRLGVHEVQGCVNQGLILLLVNGENNEIEALLKDLKNYPNVRVNAMDVR